MTLQAVNPRFPPYTVLSTALATTTFTFDATTDRMAYVFLAPKTGTLDRAEFNIGSITTWPTGGVQCGWQNLTETATPSIPDGTFTHSVTVTTSPGAGWWNPGSFVDGGAAKRAVTRGDALAIVVAPVSGTTSFTMLRLDDAGTAPNHNSGLFPYSVVNASGSYVATPDQPLIALFYDGETEPVWVSAVPLTFVSLGSKSISNANPDYGGLIFQVKESCKCGGMVIRCDTNAITKFSLITNNAASTLAERTWDLDRRYVDGTGWMVITFTSEATLSVNTDYRLIMDNSGSATAATIGFATVAAAGHRAAWPVGITGNWTQSDDGTTWAETTTDIPFIYPILTAFDDGAGGGGGLLTHSGMLGGMRG